jgi:hypothetical protein
VILDEALRLMAALALANRLSDKCEALAEASGRLDALRIALRLAKRLAFLCKAGYARLSETADEVARMLDGWLEHERGRHAVPASTRAARSSITRPLAHEHGRAGGR